MKTKKTKKKSAGFDWRRFAADQSDQAAHDILRGLELLAEASEEAEQGLGNMARHSELRGWKVLHRAMARCSLMAQALKER